MWQDRSKNFYIIVSAAIILIVAAFVYFAFFLYKERSAPETPLSGFLTLTLRPRVENATTSVYFYNLKDKKFTFLNDKNSLNINAHGLPSGDAVTSSSFFAAAGTPDENVFQLYQVDMKNNFMKKQITSSRTFLKRHPELSPDGQKIAFMAKQKLDNNATSTSMDDWSVYVTDLNGNEKLLGPGAYPQWSPDSRKLLFLRSEGLYLYNLEKEIGAKVWGMADGRAVLRMNIDVSRDGSHLAWSVPNNHQVILAKISSWEPFNLGEQKTIDEVFAFWPVFSPKGEYLAAITGDEEGIGVAKPWVTIYNTETLESQKVLDLNYFSVNAMTLTDWGILN
ncbi:MAG: hypothetical protein PHT44_00540 [Candidatus Portnoybacteria bacterium]|nr:hypothetical protein [Candidatus Portnoybacteria bacterium]MDD4982898.1 hypothetical protein [Candidatus Portnoybacteria bacterium]